MGCSSLIFTSFIVTIIMLTHVIRSTKPSVDLVFLFTFVSFSFVMFDPLENTWKPQKPESSIQIIHLVHFCSEPFLFARWRFIYSKFMIRKCLFLLLHLFDYRVNHFSPIRGDVCLKFSKSQIAIQSKDIFRIVFLSTHFHSICQKGGWMLGNWKKNPSGEEVSKISSYMTNKINLFAELIELNAESWENMREYI